MRNLADKLCPEIADSETCGGDGTITATIDTSKTNTATAQFYLYGIKQSEQIRLCRNGLLLCRLSAATACGQGVDILAL